MVQYVQSDTQMAYLIAEQSIANMEPSMLAIVAPEQPDDTESDDEESLVLTQKAAVGRHKTRRRRQEAPR